MKNNFKNLLETLVFLLILAPTLSWGLTFKSDGSVVDKEGNVLQEAKPIEEKPAQPNNSNENPVEGIINIFKAITDPINQNTTTPDTKQNPTSSTIKNATAISVVQQIRFVNEGSEAIDYEEYVKPLKTKKIRPEIVISRDGSTVVTIRTIEDQGIQEFRLWKIQIDPEVNLQSFGAFQIDLAAFEIDLPLVIYEENWNSLPFKFNAVFAEPFEGRQKITLSELALSDDGSKIAFAFRNQDRSAIDVAIFQTLSGEQEFSSQVVLDERVQSITDDIPLTCGLAFHPLKSELIICRGASYEVEYPYPLDFHLSSIDLNTGKVLLNGPSSRSINAYAYNNPIEIGLYPQGTLKISKDAKYISTNAKGYCSIQTYMGNNLMPPDWLGFFLFLNHSSACNKISSPLIYSGVDLSFESIDPLEKFASSLKDHGSDREYWVDLLHNCHKKTPEDNCQSKYNYDPYLDKRDEMIEERNFGFPVGLEYLPNGYTMALMDAPDNGYYYYDGNPDGYEYTEQKVKTIPHTYWDIEYIKPSSNPLIALSNDEKIILLIDENDDRIYFHLKDQTPTIILKLRSNKLYTAVTPKSDHGFLMLGYEIKYVRLADDFQDVIDTANLQKKGIELLQAGFEEEALETLLQSYFNNNSWDNAPYLTLGRLGDNTRCHDVCNVKRTTKLPIEFKLSLYSKLYSQRINNNLTPSLGETSEQKAYRLDSLSYAYINYAIMASYNGQMGLVEQAINKLEPLLNDPANTKLGFIQEHYAMLNLLKANLIAQTDPKKAYSFLLQKDNIEKAYNWHDIGMLESVQTLKQDRQKFCYVLALSEEDCGSKFLDMRDYKNHDFYDLNGNLIQGAKINKSLSEMKEETPELPKEQNNSGGAVTILD